MSLEKNPEPAAGPAAVRLTDLLAMLAATSLRARMEGAELVADHGAYTTRVSVESVPRTPGVTQAPVTVVRVATELPSALRDDPRFRNADSMAMLNRFAALGAVTLSNGRPCVLSRLTIFPGQEQAWGSLHVPLLGFTIVGGCEAILGGLRRSLGGGGFRTGASAWTDVDLGVAQAVLSRISVCNTGAGRLTAEFGLAAGETSAVFGSRRTALWELATDAPHPEMGGGLFCLLSLPHFIADDARREALCGALNEREVSAGDQPPHFGAWVPGQREGTLAYVSFLPNVLHRVPGIATNVSTWAMFRTRWADAQLRALGVRA